MLPLLLSTLLCLTLWSVRARALTTASLEPSSAVETLIPDAEYLAKLQCFGCVGKGSGSGREHLSLELELDVSTEERDDAAEDVWRGITESASGRSRLRRWDDDDVARARNDSALLMHITLPEGKALHVNGLPLFPPNLLPAPPHPSLFADQVTASMPLSGTGWECLQQCSSHDSAPEGRETARKMQSRAAAIECLACASAGFGNAVGRQELGFAYYAEQLSTPKDASRRWRITLDAVQARPAPLVFPAVSDSVCPASVTLLALEQEVLTIELHDRNSVSLRGDGQYQNHALKVTSLSLKPRSRVFDPSSIPKTDTMHPTKRIGSGGNKVCGTILDCLDFGDKRSRASDKSSSTSDRQVIHWLPPTCATSPPAGGSSIAGVFKAIGIVFAALLGAGVVGVALAAWSGSFAGRAKERRRPGAAGSASENLWLEEMEGLLDEGDGDDVGEDDDGSAAAWAEQERRRGRWTASAASDVRGSLDDGDEGVADVHDDDAHAGADPDAVTALLLTPAAGDGPSLSAASSDGSPALPLRSPVAAAHLDKPLPEKPLPDTPAGG